MALVWIAAKVPKKVSEVWIYCVCVCVHFHVYSHLWKREVSNHIALYLYTLVISLEEDWSLSINEDVGTHVQVRSIECTCLLSLGVHVFMYVQWLIRYGNDLYLVSPCMGLDRNVDYQFGEGFVTLWTSVYAEILKICHMVYIHVGMYVSVSVWIFLSFF